MSSGERRNTILAEFLGLVCMAGALMLLISLVTYDGRDPVPFFKSGLGGPARNFIGPVGAFVAELMMAQLFGLAALVLPFAMGFAGWRLFWCRPVEAPYTKVCGVVLLLLSTTALLALAWPVVHLGGAPLRTGGALGELLGALLISSVGRAGGFIVSSTCIFLATILSTQLSFATILERVGAVVGGRVASARASWALQREARLKDEMRREVIRKHTHKDKEPSPRETAAAEPEEKAVLPFAGGPTLLGDDDGLAAEIAPLLEKAPSESDAEPPRRARKGRVVATGPATTNPPVPATADLGAPAAEPSRSAEEPKLRRAVRPPADPEAAPAAEAKGVPAPVPTRNGEFPLPPVSILDGIKVEAKVDKSRLFEKARVLQAKSGEFGVNGNVVEIHPGPVVTTYEFKPDAGVKYSRVVGLSDDLALALEAESIRIDRMSGRGTVAIEIPNEQREIIYLREILESDQFKKAPSKLTMALGKNVSGEIAITDLAGMPHLLIAGSTGTGKSVGLNCMIASLLYKSTPDDVRLILIDPKRLELGVYEDIPHLLCPVVTEPKLAANVLKWAVGEMEKRIRRLASEGVRNIDQFNSLMRSDDRPAPAAGASEEDGKPLHYIVIIIDELADLMMVSSHEVEESITRLAQMARAVGIHLILATQRPSVDVITGLIKANFPSRISFRVAARVDSRTILDSIGAEHLLGKGDMLFLPPGSARLTRIHGAFVTEHEIARLTSYLRKAGKPEYDNTVGQTEKTTAEGTEIEERDELYEEAARFVVQSKQASTSGLQRRFRIGFSRAGRLIDMLERDGIIGPADGSKPREILVSQDYYETVDSWPK